MSQTNHQPILMTATLFLILVPLVLLLVLRRKRESLTEK